MTRFKAKSVGQSGLDEQHADLSSDQVIARPLTCEPPLKRPGTNSARVARARSAKASPAFRSRNGAAVAALCDGKGESAGGRQGPSGQQDLAILETRLQDLASLVSDWIWETDDALRLTYASPRVTEALGHEPADRVISEAGTTKEERVCRA